LIYLAVSRKYKEIIINRRTLSWFGLAGFFSGAGILANLTALDKGSVVIVAPLVATVPLWIVFLSLLFLRAHERVTVKIAVGAASICLGGVVLTVF
jgi:uncharacterized membrane protein